MSMITTTVAAVMAASQVLLPTSNSIKIGITGSCYGYGYGYGLWPGP